MSGNVFEWVNDWYSSSYYSTAPTTDPLGPSTGSSRVYRGGGWGGDATVCRSAFRYYYSPVYYSDSNLGFRLARSIPLHNL